MLKTPATEGIELSGHFPHFVPVVKTRSAYNAVPRVTRASPPRGGPEGHRRICSRNGDPASSPARSDRPSHSPPKPVEPTLAEGTGRAETASGNPGHVALIGFRGCGFDTVVRSRARSQLNRLEPEQIRQQRPVRKVPASFVRTRAVARCCRRRAVPGAPPARRSRQTSGPR